MRVLLFLFFSVFLSLTSFGQRFEWLETFSNSGSAVSNRAVKVYGNSVVVSGDFQNSISFGSTVLTAGSSSIPNVRNIYVANFDTLGNLQWAIKGGSSNGGETFKNLEIDDFGNIYVAGLFNTTISWGNFSLSKTSPGSSTFSQEGFLVKLNSQGVPQWINGLYDSSGSFGFSGLELMSAADSSVYLGGIFTNGVTIAGTNNSISATGIGGGPPRSTVFIARFDLNGNANLLEPIVKFTSSNSLSTPGDIKAIDNNSFYYTGSHNDANQFGSNNQTFTNLTSAAVVAKFTNANCDWLRAGTSSSPFFSSFNPNIAIDNNNNLVVAGTFRSTLNFQSTTVNSSIANGLNWFSARFNPAGNLLTLKNYNINGTSLQDMTINSKNETIVIGNYRDSIELNGTKRFSNGGEDILVVALEDNLDLKWFQTGGGGNFDAGIGVQSDNSPNFYLLGLYRGLSQFGSTFFSGAINNTNSILIKMSECGTTPIPLTINGDTNLCSNQSVRIVAAPTSSSTFQWLKDSVVLSSEIFRDILTNVPGNYQVIVNGAGCIDTSRAIPIRAGTQANVSYNLNDTVCLQDSPFPLSGGTPLGGIYRGRGISNNTFDPSAAGIGNVSVTYVFDNGGCPDSAIGNIFVKPAPSVFIAPISPVCINSGNVTLGNAFPIGGVFSGNGVSGNSFDPIAAGRGNTTITYTYSDGSGCIGTASTTIRVDTLETATFSPIADVCLNSSPFTLTQGSPSGGIYQGPGVVNGNFDPSATGSGTFSINYIISNQCGNDTASRTITVLPQPSVSLGAFTDICQGSSAFSLTGGLPVGGTYSGVGVSNGIFNPTVAGVGTSTIFYSITDNNGCSNIDSSTITVNPQPIIDITSDTSTCFGESVTLSANGGINYAWSNGSITASISVTPTADSTFAVTVSNSNSCSSVDSVRVTVNALPTASISGNTTICQGESTALIANGGVGYSWSNGQFNDTIQVSPTIDSTFTVTVTNTSGCIDTQSQLITVNPLPTVSLASFIDVCENSAAISLSGGTPAGGTYSGIGVSNGNFDPTVAGVGTSTIFYSITDNSGCSNIDSSTITVNPQPTISISSDTAICFGESVTLSANSGTNYVWSNGSTTASISVTPTADSTFTVTVSNGNSCSSVDSVRVTVNALPTTSISGNTILCEGESTTLIASGGVNYSWSSGQLNNTIQISPSLDSTFTVTVTNGNGCVDTESQLITVNPLPTVSLPSFSDVCENSAATSLSGGVPAGGTYSGIGVSNGNFDPTLVGVGTSTIFYSVTDNNGCSNVDSSTITVNAIPTISISNDTSICVGESVTLSANGGTNYTWSNNVTSPSITVSPTINTTYSVTVSDGNSCTSTANVIVTVNPTPNFTLSNDTAICVGNNVILRTGNAVNTNYVWSNNSVGNVISVSPTATTDYIVTGTNSFGCDLTDTVTVTVNFGNPINIGADTLLNFGDSAVFDAGAGFTSYLWSDASSAQSLTVFYDASKAGQSETIGVTAINNNSCPSVDSAIVSYALPTGLSDGSNEADQISVYPNPVSQLLTIRFNEKVSENKRIQLFDGKGRIVYDNQVNTNKKQLEIDIAGKSISKGIYFLNITSGNSEESFSKKIIVQ